MPWWIVVAACACGVVAFGTPLSAAPAEPRGGRWLFPLPGSLLNRSPVLVYGVFEAGLRYSPTAWWVGPNADGSPVSLPVEVYWVSSGFRDRSIIRTAAVGTCH